MRWDEKLIIINNINNFERYGRERGRLKGGEPFFDEASLSSTPEIVAVSERFVCAARSFIMYPI